MTKACFALAVVATLTTAGCPKGSKRPGDIHADPLPLAAGAKWTYAVTIKRFDIENNKDVESQLEWTTEVVEVKPGDGFTAYVVKGWPSDLASFEGATPTPSTKTLLRAHDKFLWAGPDGGVEGSEGWFAWPLTDGQEVCPDPSVVYCWRVASSEDGYELTYFTGPDEEKFLLQPGTGVAGYHYAHHGTTGQVTAKLTDYQKGKPTPAE